MGSPGAWLGGRPRALWDFFKRVYGRYEESRLQMLAASLAYYGAFSLGPLLLLLAGWLAVFLRRRPELISAPLLLVAVLATWELVSQAQLLSHIVLPPASSVAEQLRTLLTSYWFPDHVKATAIETLVGFGLGSVLAVAVAVVLYHVPILRRTLYPYIVTFHLTPSIVLAPIFVIWFGLGIESKIVIAVGGVDEIRGNPAVVEAYLGN